MVKAKKERGQVYVRLLSKLLRVKRRFDDTMMGTLLMAGGLLQGGKNYRIGFDLQLRADRDI